MYGSTRKSEVDVRFNAMQLEDLNGGAPLMPKDDAKLRAQSRLWADHVSFLFLEVDL